MRSGDSDVLPYLKALVLLQLEALGDRDAGTKPELLLHRAGVEMMDIAKILNKKYTAVAKTINRAKKDN